MKQTLPNTWHLARLSQVCEVNPRDPIPSDVEGEVSFVPMSAIDEVMGEITEAEPRDIAEVRTGYTPFCENDVLFAKITPCMQNGKAAVAKGLIGGRGFGSTEFHVLRAGPHVLPEWLFFLVRNPVFRKRAKAAFTGSAGQQRVPTAFLISVQVPLPPLSEQRRIVAMLREAQAVRRLRRQADDLTAKLIPAIFHEMFGDPSTANHIRLGKLLAESPQNGLYKPADQYGEGTRIIRIGDFYDGRITDVTALQRLRLSEKEIDRYGVQTDEILVNRVNSVEYLGKSAIVPVMDEPAVFESNMMRLKVDRAKVRPTYLLAYLQTDYALYELRRRAKLAVNQASINQGDVQSLPVPVPALEHQDEFLRLLAAVADASSALGSSIGLLSDLQDSLLANAFSGELTGDWREKNRDLLEREAAERDAAIKAAGVKLARPERPVISVAVPTTGRHAELNREQRELLRQIKLAVTENGQGPAFTLGSMRDWLSEPLDKLPEDALRRHLDVLAARGLVRVVSRRVAGSSGDGAAFGNVFRLPREHASDGGEPSDHARMEELTRMARAGRIHDVSVGNSLSLSGSVDVQADQVKGG
ncbi:MAG: restriction endonuclease subunit S [Planctomycetaceae bacterium]|nr:restriction endonuclease subunit S [Planctomycetaceae bacterium]